MLPLASSGAVGLADVLPAIYVARRLPPGSPPLEVDGNLDKAEWSAAQWSADFEEIRGVEDAPEGSRPSAACRTRMKMLWDDEFLYIGAILESDREVVASFTERNAPIFQLDSDFEVFVDPAGGNQWYKELEVNAINTVWNLMLNKPYMDGGDEYSGRIAVEGEARYYEAVAQRTATRVLSGQLGDSGGATWSVEVALAHSDTLAMLPAVARPAVGSRWRINFSRVEERGAVNWVWAPQRVWEPTKGRYEGKVNMHLPDAWGVVEFAPPDGATLESSSWVQREWPARQAAMSVYYAQRAQHEQHGVYAASVDGLAVDAALLASFEVRIERQGESTGAGGA